MLQELKVQHSFFPIYGKGIVPHPSEISEHATQIASHRFACVLGPGQYPAPSVRGKAQAHARTHRRPPNRKAVWIGP